jgi:hypothetical protein
MAEFFQGMGVLELELDDWLDPSLPRMYMESELGLTDFILSDEFTSSNDGFDCTGVLPPFIPSIAGGSLMFIPVSDTRRGGGLDVIHLKA